MGGSPIGLDWPQVQSLAAGLSVPWCRDTISCLQVMETAAVTVWSRCHHDHNRHLSNSV